MLFAPAHTTSTGVRASSVRSAEMSHAAAGGRWAPPMPPVANTRTPAACDSVIVALTVVAAIFPRPMAAPRSRRLVFSTPVASANSASCASVSPTVGTPFQMATVAGVAPPARTTVSHSRATCRLTGRGSPWAMSVDSSATTGRPRRSASATSGERAGRTGNAGMRKLVRM
jgi:hypothetical protein